MSRKERGAISVSKERSLLTHQNPKSPIAEQYRTIRTNIQFAAVEEEIRTIMVTSSGPMEGKSTTIANLGVVLAQQGKRVLIADTDLRKPTVHYTFRVMNTRGLTNVLTRQAELTEVTLETEVPNLEVLTSGPVPPNPSELLGSKAMDTLIEEALSHYDIILFDCPPVLAVADSQIIANKVQGTVLVISSGTTEREAAIKAKERLESAKGKLLGVVLNRKKMKDGSYYYYYAQK
ncbi:CpsD/CapB family tyrosine-protein kinase [Alkalihalobacillus macyae]|uniref:CpsD/CapB family tyrosine-protein kinase n=1 Tax=Guptibacillus hwajinpoensis TaxID=208199 RepID=UPI00273C179F|nr:CpsD/CapB family tyrosine-protein kinase [Alkalihalobacillus macyae]MDP4551655.1 CpsD/CapB family tyrosine-protein kinase [Alkalihalobacillus macyae]